MFVQLFTVKKSEQVAVMYKLKLKIKTITGHFVDGGNKVYSQRYEKNSCRGLVRK